MSAGILSQVISSQLLSAILCSSLLNIKLYAVFLSYENYLRKLPYCQGILCEKIMNFNGQSKFVAPHLSASYE